MYDPRQQGEELLAERPRLQRAERMMRRGDYFMPVILLVLVYFEIDTGGTVSAICASVTSFGLGAVVMASVYRRRAWKRSEESFELLRRSLER